ncbi:MAG TPA: serine hydrolase [archaeon]|nr:serine hydrolase [archaeon]
MKKNSLLTALVASLFINTATPREAENQIPRYVVMEEPRAYNISPEYASAIDTLRNYFSDYVKAAGKKGRLTKNDKVSFVVYDIGNDTYVVNEKGNDQVMAASTIKVFALSLFFEMVDSGKLVYGWMDRDNLRKMIKLSDNKATNTVIRNIGYALGMPVESAPDAAQAVLMDKHPEFAKTEIREFIPENGRDNGRTYRNMTSAMDLVEYYRRLWDRTLPYSDEMLKYLGLPKNTRLFTGGCNTSEDFNKTGTLYGQVSDAGLVLIKGSDGKDHPYVIAAIIEDRTKTIEANRKKSYGRWVRERETIIRDLSKQVYMTLYREHIGKDYTCKPPVKKPVKKAIKKPTKRYR